MRLRRRSEEEWRELELRRLANLTDVMDRAVRHGLSLPKGRIPRWLVVGGYTRWGRKTWFCGRYGQTRKFNGAGVEIYDLDSGRLVGYVPPTLSMVARGE